MGTRFVNSETIRQKWDYTEISKNGLRRIRVLFVKYRVLFIEIELLKHEDHDTRKQYVDKESILRHLAKFSCVSTFCQEKNFKQSLMKAV